ncbi:metallophosphoesterase [Pseudomonas costantinii]|uniref:Serine/threonine protein phosphatase n=1 Tax=Pseudomonas costantinii TaxID=168469 RepID=A0A1S2UER8_9PSED|nr:metallophosphoesterase [Pseudomonas costantinii]OIN44536.1 serine/threonine protein phosphatase [Pseudomonas costantinii]SED27058.1 serine/threonine protein phosphatase 1 [Pseudomonas costantinii]
MTQVKRFAVNTAGRDFAVGDIHGHFNRLQAALDAAGFDPAVDRLFSVGDLVDRGPESLDVDEWVLRKPWFHAVRGNHEQMTVDSYASGRTSDECGMHFINGGQWFYGLSSVEQGCYASILQDLPIAIEIETAQGLIGVVHADVPRGSWEEMLAALAGPSAEAEHAAAMVQWSRKRITDDNRSGVSGVRAVIVGHTPMRYPAILGNVYHIDTAGWADGHFTLIDLNTLEYSPQDWESRP